MTGMPAFDKTLSTTQMWQVSLLLADADKLPASVKDGLTTVAASPVVANTPAKTSAPAKK